MRKSDDDDEKKNCRRRMKNEKERFEEVEKKTVFVKLEI